MFKSTKSIQLLVIMMLVLLGARVIFSWEPFGNLVDRLVSPISSSIYSLGHSQGEQEDTVLVDALNEQLLDENARLKNQLDVANEESVSAEVIRIDMASYRKNVWINVGSNSGVEVGDAVLSDGFLFGQVTSTSDVGARVRVVTDPDFIVTAKHGEEHGVVGSKHGSLTFDLVPSSEVESGSLVVTDGLDGEFKPGLPIAVVDKNITEQGRVFFTYSIFLNKNPIDVRFVQVQGR